MLRMARGLLAQMPGRLVAVGVSFGGPVDASRGLVRLSHHVAGWEDAPLRDRLEAEFGAPVAVDNDANVATLGEWRYGAGQGCDSLLYVTVSTGIGGGWC
jgi:glucokinase